LKTLRHFPSAETEWVLLKVMAEHDAKVRAAALGSLGWWEPLARGEVVAPMRRARLDRHADVRRAAEAAFARLGERQALQWFRLQFAGENSDPIHHAIQATADEGLVLLWPDLDRLADAEDGDVAYHACEALEQLRESMSVSGSLR
jgi:HEAT repeat protein